MMIRTKRLLIALLLLVIAASCFGNPFLKDSESVVRTPTGTGVMPEYQMDLRERAATSINSFLENPTFTALAILLGASFLYGLLHAAGPGHRKTIIFSLFLGREAKPWEPLAAGFMAGIIHAGTGILLILILSWIRGSIANIVQAEVITSYIDAGTFGGILLLSIILLILGIFRIRRKHAAEAAAEAANELPPTTNVYSVIAVASLVPCPGATMILLFAMYAEALGLGIIAVLFMSLGMGIVISAAGYLAYTGRVGLFKGLSARKQLLKYISEGLELFSYLLLVGFSLYMLMPFIKSLF